MKKNFSKVVLMCIFQFMFILVSSTAYSSYQYIISDIGTTSSHWYSLNDLGQVVGRLRTESGEDRAFIWDRVNGMLDLGPGYAVDINNSGQVVIHSGVRTLLWDSTNSMQYIGDNLGEEHINNLGQVVANGYSTTDPYQVHAFLWDTLSGLRDLGTLNVFEPIVWGGINDYGQIAGYTHWEAFLYDIYSGNTTILGSLMYDIFGETWALDINNSGQVVGTGEAWFEPDHTNIIYHAFLWDSLSGMKDLGTFYEYSEAWSINDLSQVVGYYQPMFDNNSHAFLWDNVNGRLDLNDLLYANSGWQLTSAVDINDSGQIVGIGILRDEEHGFLLTPTITSTIIINPKTLYLRSSGGSITAYIEFPEGYDVSQINIRTVNLSIAGVPVVGAKLSSSRISDYDNDGIPDLTVKFDRQKVQRAIKVAGSLEMTVTGYLKGGTIHFHGSDIVNVRY